MENRRTEREDESTSSNVSARKTGSSALTRPQVKAEARPAEIGGRQPQRDSGGRTDRGYLTQHHPRVDPYGTHRRNLASESATAVSTSVIPINVRGPVGDTPKSNPAIECETAKGCYRIGGGQITPRRSYLDQGGTTPLLRAYAIDCPKCSC